MARSKPDQTFEFHHLSYTQPNMTPQEYTDLRDDIWRKGLLDPVTLYEGKILDGRHRYTACREIKIPVRWEDLPDDIDPIDFIESKNDRRRNLDVSQRSLAAMRTLQARAAQEVAKTAKRSPDGLLDWGSVLPKNWKDGGVAAKPGGKLVLTEAQTKQIAQKEDVSSRSIRHAQKVVNEGVPDLAKAVAERKISIAKAATIAEQPKASQAKALEAEIEKPRKKPEAKPPVCPCGGVCPCHRV